MSFDVVFHNGLEIKFLIVFKSIATYNSKSIKALGSGWVGILKTRKSQTKSEKVRREII
jgi:hypothetical protein